MKILIANKFYYNRGGDCIASIALEKLLKEKGHNVAFFSMQHPMNLSSPWESYFPSEVDFQSAGLTKKIHAALRIFHSSEVVRNFSNLLETFHPDIVHLNNIHSQISPVIGEIAHKHNIKVIWTLHDKKLICPTYSCLRNGKPCELCFTQNRLAVIKHKCMKNSYAASVLSYLEALVWNKNRLMEQTNSFIAPSEFLKSLMIKGGFPETQIKVLPHFSDRDFSIPETNKQNYYCYVGRLSEEKGVTTLVKVAKELPYKLVIIGEGPLKQQLQQYNQNIDFVGFKEWNEMQDIIAKAKFLISPSECYEVFGLSNIEALSLGTPVLGANIGGIPELINEHNGMLFEAGNAVDMREKIEQMFSNTYNYTDICTAAREKYSAESYYRKLIEIYEQ